MYTFKVEYTNVLNTITQATVLHAKSHVFKHVNKSLNKLFSSGPFIEIQHDVSYKAKFMAAVRLWRKREEEKRVWEMFFCIFVYF